MMTVMRSLLRPLRLAAFCAVFAAGASASAGEAGLYPNKPGKKSGPTGRIGAVVGPAPAAAPDVVLGAAGRLGGADAPDYGFVAGPGAAARDPGVEVGFRAETRFRNKRPGS